MRQARLKSTLIITVICSCLLLSAMYLLIHDFWPEMPSIGAAGQTAMTGNMSAGTEKGYFAAVYADGYFLAAGTEGRLDKIFPDKQMENLTVPTTADLTGIWTDNAVTLVCGTEATLLYSTDGTTYRKGDTDISSDINGVTCFGGAFYACAEGGVILTSQDGMCWETERLGTEHDFVAIAATEKDLMAVTAESDIFTSEDGRNWQQYNFNEKYTGFYEPYTFTRVSGMGDLFFVIGKLADKPGSPLIMFSETGEVWTQKQLSQINGEVPDESFSLKINAIGFDSDQLLAACDKGRLLTVTDCTVCNQLAEVMGVDLTALAYGEGKLLVVGDNFAFDVLDSAQVRQYKIKAEQAIADAQNGAVFIDVRTGLEYDTGHIEGSINIPVTEIKDKLADAVPDKQTEIIFYCASGKRSQAALETAVDMGYGRVYNLGGLEADWPYALTK